GGMPILASLLFNPNSPAGHVFYPCCIGGWLFGGVLGDGRLRGFVLGGVGGFFLLVIFFARFLLLATLLLPGPRFFVGALFFRFSWRRRGPDTGRRFAARDCQRFCC